MHRDQYAEYFGWAMFVVALVIGTIGGSIIYICIVRYG